MRLVEIADDRRDDILRERRDRLLQVDVLTGQTVIHHCSFWGVRARTTREGLGRPR